MGVVYLANTGSDLLRIFYGIPNFDKVGHFTLFGILAFFVNKAMGCKKTEVLGNVVLTGSLWIVLFVGLEELSQIFIATRNFDVSDLMYDLVGIYLGGFIAVVTSQPFINWKIFERVY